MAKHRTSIPEKLAAHVRWLSDDTCCICTEREKDIQLHHIDKDPSNHSIENLVALCLECHNKIHKKGGITRGMTPQFIILCRDKWFETVVGRRKEADERDVDRRVGKNIRGDQSKDRPRNKIQHTQLSEFPRGYIHSLPKFKSDLFQQIKIQKSGGTTLDIIEADSHYANALKGILVTLAAFYSPEYFDDQSPQEFLSEIISERDRFHTIIAEPHGVGTGGTISGIYRGCLRVKDIENLIEIMVYGLLYPKGSYDDIDFADWQKQWREIAKNSN